MFINSRSNPSRGTIFFSSPRAVPTNKICVVASRRLNSWAIARPGKMCPPVPPAAMMTLILILDFGLPILDWLAQGDPKSKIGNPKSSCSSVLGDVQQHPRGEETDRQGRSARADKRQRNSFCRNERQSNTDVEKRLRDDHCRQPDCHQL